MLSVDEILMVAVFLGIWLVQYRIFTMLNARRFSDLLRIATARDGRLGLLAGVLFLLAVQIFGLQMSFRNSSLGAIGQIGIPILLATIGLCVALAVSRYRAETKPN